MSSRGGDCKTQMPKFPSDAATVLLEVLFAMAVVWIVLMGWLFRRLKEHHVSIYEALGSPSIKPFQKNHDPRAGRFFCWGSQCLELGDPAVANVCRFMRVFFVLYVVLFLWAALMIFGELVRYLKSI